MSYSTPQEFREAVRSQTDLVSLIGESISLQPRHGGRHYVGLCPFHEDNNPSLNVYPDRQTFRCWSCQTGGDCFTFLMEREKVTFPEALELLARRANLPIPTTLSRSTPDQETNRAKLLEVLLWAENEFHHALKTLPVAEKAREYLASRGFHDDIVSKYRLGFHPDDWTWLLKRAESKYPVKLLAEARLIGNRDGRHYDNFVNRVLFPIHNERGQPVSFGGRILPGSSDEAKYWNGPESVVFHKSRLLYGIDYARDAIRKTDQAIVVEGYTDCITCHQYGVENVVATLGTALTDSHVTALKRYARQVVLIFDGDDAGQNAARKAVERFLAQDVELRILTLPEKLDPAEFLAAYNSDEFRQLTQNAPEAWDYQLRATLTQHGTTSVAGRQWVLEDMIRLLAQVPNLSGSLRESMLIANLAQRVQVSQETVRDQLKEARRDGKPASRSVKPTGDRTEQAREIQRIFQGRLSPVERVEYDLLEQVLGVPGCVPFVSRKLFDSSFRNPVLQTILDLCLWEAEEQGELSLAGLLARVEDPELKNLVVWIDEQVIAKGLATKVNDSGFDDDGCPNFVKQSLERLSWCEEERNNSFITEQLTLQGTGPGRLDDAAQEALLEQAAEFHRKRANRATL
ncbi:MAG TPA: DNA primase [Planctomicrobium sp.]|nr:DNA primase [Planctomicrobium sp.]